MMYMMLGFSSGPDATVFCTSININAKTNAPAASKKDYNSGQNEFNEILPSDAGGEEFRSSQGVAQLQQNTRGTRNLGELSHAAANCCSR